jgi:hypothetical protein
MWASGLKGVKVMKGGMGATPAMVGNESGIVFLNVEKLSGLSEDQIHSIITHEQGHVLGKTTNEYKADAIGFGNYAKTGRSLKASYHTLLKFLPFNKEQDFERLKKQTVRALLFDYKNNGNKKAMIGIKKIMSENLQNVERV